MGRSKWDYRVDVEHFHTSPYIELELDLDFNDEDIDYLIGYTNHTFDYANKMLSNEIYAKYRENILKEFKHLLKNKYKANNQQLKELVDENYENSSYSPLTVNLHHEINDDEALLTIDNINYTNDYSTYAFEDYFVENPSELLNLSDDKKAELQKDVAKILYNNNKQALIDVLDNFVIRHLYERYNVNGIKEITKYSNLIKYERWYMDNLEVERSNLKEIEFSNKNKP